MTTEERATRRTGRCRGAGTRRRRPIELVIVDESPVLRAGVRTLFDNEADVAVVAEARTVNEAVDLCRAAAPDVVLLDVDMGDLRQIHEMQRLRREVPSGALVVLGRHDDDEGLYRAVVGGAVGHVGDGEGPAQLVETIREAADGGDPIQRTLAERPEVARRVLETYADLVQHSPATNDNDLTEREMRILELAAEGKTNQQIGRAIGLSEHTIKGAISGLLARLRLHHRTEAVVHALRLGWIAPPRSMSTNGGDEAEDESADQP